jgi:hypothetical protein
MGVLEPCGSFVIERLEIPMWITYRKMEEVRYKISPYWIIKIPKKTNFRYKFSVFFFFSDLL